MAGVTLETMRILVVVAFSSFITEWLCSLHLEIRYIWKNKFCLLTWCFLGARYITMINLCLMVAMFHGQWTEDACNRVYLAMPILATLGMLCAEGVCCIRIWTIHKRSPLILSLLGIFLTATACVQSYAITNYVAFREGGSCVAAGKGLWLSFYWIAPAILDLIILVMAMTAVAYETRRFGRNRLLNVILRDQVLYFFLVFSACIISGVLMSANSSYLQSLNNPPAITISSIGATRIVLSLKGEGDRVQGGSSGRQQNASTSGQSSRWMGKKGIFSWWTTSSSSGHDLDCDKHISSDAGSRPIQAPPKSWYQQHSPAATMNAKVRDDEDALAYMPGFGHRTRPSGGGTSDLELGVKHTGSDNSECHVVQVVDDPHPPRTNGTTSYFSVKGRPRMQGDMVSLSVGAESTPTDANTLASIAEHGHEMQPPQHASRIASSQPAAHPHPYADERLIGLGDTTTYGSAIPTSSSDRTLLSHHGQTASQSSIRDSSALRSATPTDARNKPWAGGKNFAFNTKTIRPAGLSAQYNGCCIKTTTTTTVSRSSLVGPSIAQDGAGNAQELSQLTGDFPSPPLSSGCVTGLPTGVVDDPLQRAAGTTAKDSQISLASAPSRYEDGTDEVDEDVATAHPSQGATNCASSASDEDDLVVIHGSGSAQ